MCNKGSVGQLGGWSLCNCPCHRMASVKHTKACCTFCNFCKENIRGDFNAHYLDMHSVSMKEGGGWTECHCVCHTETEDDEPLAKHCVHCCVPCGICGMNIADGLDAHMKDQHPDSLSLDPSVVSVPS